MQLPSRSYITIRVAPQRCSYPHVTLIDYSMFFHMSIALETFARLNATYKFAKVNATICLHLLWQITNMAPKPFQYVQLSFDQRIEGKTILPVAVKSKLMGQVCNIIDYTPLSIADDTFGIGRGGSSLHSFPGGILPGFAASGFNHGFDFIPAFLALTVHAILLTGNHDVFIFGKIVGDGAKP